MLVGGLPERNEDHARHVANIAIEMIMAIQKVKLSFMSAPLAVKIGTSFATHYHSIPLITIHYHSLPLITTQYHSYCHPSNLYNVRVHISQVCTVVQ